MDTIRVLIVDDQELLRSGIRTLLDLEGGFTIVGMAQNGEEAVAAYEVGRPDVVLMDIRMPAIDGIAAAKRIIARDANARILMLTTFAEDSLIFDALRAGARGYLLKDASASELAAAVRDVHAGNGALGPGIAMTVIRNLRESTAQPQLEPTSDYSRRELEVLRLLAEGFSNKEIAERLFLAEGTVKNRVSDILLKINARDRTQAALRARELGLL